MRESLERVTIGGVVDVSVANSQDTVMQALKLEEERERQDDESPLIEPKTPDIESYPHKSKSSRRILTHPRMHVVAVAGLLVTGAFVIYATALHMGFVASSDETGASLDQTWLNHTSPSVNTTHNDDAVAPTSTADANSSAGAAGVGSFTVAVPAAAPAVSLGTEPQAGSPEAEHTILVAVPAVAPAGSLGTEPPAGSPQAEPSGPARVYYQNASETWHSMSDVELLRKATSGEEGREREWRRGVPRGVKVAFLFMARGPLPLAPLWERYFRGHEHMYSLYVHANPNFVPTFASSSPFFRRFVPSKVVLWGQLSGYEAERRLLGNALLDPTNAWFLLLSESCIPIVNFPATFAYFNNSPNVSFIESFSEPRGGRLHRGQFEAMAPEITDANFRKGSQWFQITRPLALLAAQDSTYYTKFHDHFCAIHAVCYIDEHFLPTLAWILHPHALLAFRTLTFYQFRDKASHPTRFHAPDFDRNTILAFREGRNCTYNGNVTSSCFLFARKVDPNALGVLLDLAAPVMGIPP